VHPIVIHLQPNLAGFDHRKPRRRRTRRAQGVVDNMATPSKVGDIDQLRGIVSGECEAVSNTYHLRVVLRSTDVDGV
jgi:iron(III) transport system substrate-binding protein